MISILLTAFLFGDGSDRNYALDFFEHLSANTHDIVGIDFNVMKEYNGGELPGIDENRQPKKLTNRSKNDSYILCSSSLNPDQVDSLGDLAVKWTKAIADHYLRYIESSKVQEFRKDWEKILLPTKPIFCTGCLNFMIGDHGAAHFIVDHYDLTNCDEQSIQEVLCTFSGRKLLAFAFGKAGETEKKFITKIIKDASKAL